MLTAAVYARHSSENQRETSIEDQVARCRSAAARFGCTVNGYHTYTDMEVSGSTAERPGYKRLLSAAKEYKFQAIVVEAQDRLWRDQAEMHAALKRLKFWGVHVFSVATGADLTDPNTGSILATVSGLKDEFFLKDLKDKTHRGMSGQIDRGMSAGGRAYGYKSVLIVDGSRRDTYGQPVVVGYRKVVDETEARVVRRIFELYASGLSSKTIALRLNSERVPPPRPKRGRIAQGWTWTTITGSVNKGTGILNNPLYVGQVLWNRTRKDRDPETDRRIPRERPRDEWLLKEAPGLRIVPDELWRRVKARQHEIAGRTKQRRGGARNVPHLFSGLLRCGVCGASYTQRDRRHLACSIHRNRGPRVCPNGKVVRRDRLEERLLRVIYDDVFTADTVAYLSKKVDEVLAKRTSPPGAARKKLDAELREAEEEIENIKEAVCHGKATAMLLGMLEEAQDKARGLQARIEADQNKARAVVRAIPQVVERYVLDLRETLNRNPTRARSMLAALLDRVVLPPEKDGLWAELRPDLGVLLDEHVDSNGAGRGI